MKVNFVSTYPPTNCGIATYSRYFVEGLNERCEVNVIPLVSPNNDPRYFIGLAWKARKGADLVHVQYDISFFGERGIYTPLFYLMVRLFGGPRTVTTVHEFIDAGKVYRGQARYHLMKAYYTLIFLSLALLNGAIIVHTHDSVKLLSQYSHKGNIIVIPHPCFIKPVIMPGDECKSRLGLSGKRVLTMFGYVHRFKGHDLAIEAMKGLPEDVVLYIAGDGRTDADRQYVQQLKEKVTSMGLSHRVIFHGYVKDEDAPVVMNAADIVVMPYRHIVQSGAMNYALAYLKPVLASDMGGFSEVSREYGCIETFEPENVEAMRLAIRRILSDGNLLERLREKAKAYIACVELGAIVSSTTKVYESVLPKK